MKKIDTEGENRLPVSIFFSFEKTSTFFRVANCRSLFPGGSVGDRAQDFDSCT